LYPVDGAFVQEIASMYEAPSKAGMETCGAENVHEWLLWAAARIKYGTNYLSPKKNQFRLDDRMYEPIRKQQNEFEEELIKLENIVEQRMEWLSETLTERGEEEKAKKTKNILREHLTLEEVDI
jgi:hypothetical protein